jgi:hypothetical protein
LASLGNHEHHTFLFAIHNRARLDEWVWRDMRSIVIRTFVAHDELCIEPRVIDASFVRA